MFSGNGLGDGTVHIGAGNNTDAVGLCGRSTIAGGETTHAHGGGEGEKAGGEATAEAGEMTGHVVPFQESLHFNGRFRKHPPLMRIGLYLLFWVALQRKNRPLSGNNCEVGQGPYRVCRQ